MHASTCLLSAPQIFARSLPPKATNRNSQKVVCTDLRISQPLLAWLSEICRRNAVPNWGKSWLQGDGQHKAGNRSTVPDIDPNSIHPTAHLGSSCREHDDLIMACVLNLGQRHFSARSHSCPTAFLIHRCRWEAPETICKLEHLESIAARERYSFTMLPSDTCVHLCHGSFVYSPDCPDDWAGSRSILMANHLTATIRSATVLMALQVQAWMVWMLLLLHSSALGPSAPSGGAEWSKWSKPVEVHSYISMLIQVVWTLHGIAESPLSQKITKKTPQNTTNIKKHGKPHAVKYATPLQQDGTEGCWEREGPRSKDTCHYMSTRDKQALNLAVEWPASQTLGAHSSGVGDVTL